MCRAIRTRTSRSPTFLRERCSSGLARTASVNSSCAPAKSGHSLVPAASRAGAGGHARRRCVQSAAPGLAGGHRCLPAPLRPPALPRQPRASTWRPASAPRCAFQNARQAGLRPRGAPAMFSRRMDRRPWGRGELVPYGPIEILPGARALQYAELVFEGLKAYRSARPPATCFRPRDNWQRLERSAERLSMPVVPEALFFEAVEAIVGACHAIHTARVRTLAVLAAFSVRHRGGLFAAQFAPPFASW